MEEDVGSRLSRIEAGMVHVHEKMDIHHKAIMKMLDPIPKRLNNHDIDLAVLKNDRKWGKLFMVALAGGIGHLSHTLKSWLFG